MSEIKNEHAFKTFNNTLKEGNFKNVILLFGVEEYLVRWACNSLEKKYINSQTKALDLIKLNQDVSVDYIIESCETFSMFSNMRIVLVNDFLPLNSEKAKGYSKEEIEKLITYLKDVNRGTFLVFKSYEVSKSSSLYKAILEVGNVFDFNKLDEQTLTSFTYKEFKNNGFELDKGTIKYFIDQTGYFNRESEYRIFNLINDVIKISAYSSGGKITREAIDTVLVGDMDTFVFNFLDAISNGKKDLAFVLLENILKDTDVYQLSGLLINQFELMLEVMELKKEGLSLEKIVSQLKVHEFRVKKALQASERIGVEKIKSTLISLYEIDRNIKTGVVDGKLSLEMIVSKI